MYVIKFGSWGVLGTPKYKYRRIGYLHIPHLFGGISIPIPIARRLVMNDDEFVQL